MGLGKLPSVSFPHTFDIDPVSEKETMLPVMAFSPNSTTYQEQFPVGWVFPLIAAVFA